MKKGDKIGTIYGKTEMVMKVEDKRIFTYENLTGWYHPAKVFQIKIFETMKRNKNTMLKE